MPQLRLTGVLTLCLALDMHTSATVSLSRNQQVKGTAQVQLCFTRRLTTFCLQSDKSCPPSHAKKMLPAPTTTPQTVSFIPAGEYPSSTVYVRVVALCKNATSTGPTTATYPCARGRSVGYFQVRHLPCNASDCYCCVAWQVSGSWCLV